MAGDISALAFMQDRLPLLTLGPSNDAIATKRAQDRTTALVRVWSAHVAGLQAARHKTLECCEARPGKGDNANLVIVDKQAFDSLQDTIAGHVESIKELEQVIIKLDEIIAANGLDTGFLDDLKARQASAGSGIYQQKTNVSKLLSFYTQKNPRMSPEDVLKIPEFAEKRANADRLIKLDVDYLEKMKPIVNEIESVLVSVGC